MMEDSIRKWYTRMMVVLAAVGLLFVVVTPRLTDETVLSLLMLMVLAYASNASYSLVSRSGVRNSGTYHAFTMLLNTGLFYLVLHKLITNDLSLALFVPYTVATVFGSMNGAQVSMRIERVFGITTDLTKKKPSPQSLRAKRALMVLLGMATAVVAAVTGYVGATVAIAGLMFLDGAVYSWLRRARNTSNVPYHVGVSVVKSATFFLLFGLLSKMDMSLIFFFPYAFGSVVGAVFGQETAMWFERLIKAGMDDHLKNKDTKIVPMGWMTGLLVCAAVFIYISGSPSHAALLVALAIGQQIAFSLVSRSRNRNNMAYHMIASVFSNAVWFLTFRQIEVGNWTLDLYAPFAAGSALGSVTGVSASMAIERKLDIRSD